MAKGGLREVKRHYQMGRLLRVHAIQERAHKAVNRRGVMPLGRNKGPVDESVERPVEQREGINGKESISVWH